MLGGGVVLVGARKREKDRRKGKSEGVTMEKERR